MDLEVLGSLSNVQLAVYNYYFLRAQPCLHQICFIHCRWMEFSVDFFAQNNGTALTSRFTRVRVIPRMTRRYLAWHCLFLENHSTCMSRSIKFAFFPELLSHTNGKHSLFPNRTLKPDFHMILRIILIAPVVSKKRVGSRQRCLWVRQQNFCACFANKPNIMMDFNRTATLAPCYLHFLSILQLWEARRVPQRHSITSRTWCQRVSLISNSTHMQCEQFCFIFPTSAVFSITGIKVMISGIAFDHPNHPDHLSHLRAFPHDRFKIYTIVRIELNSIQAIEVVSVIWVICDCPNCLNIIWANGMIGVIIWKPDLKIHAATSLLMTDPLVMNVHYLQNVIMVKV